jgi:hypothetical protein
MKYSILFNLYRVILSMVRRMAMVFFTKEMAVDMRVLGITINQMA